MCGIVGYTGAREAAPILLDGLKRLEYRGYDSAGIAVAKEGRLALCKVSGRVEALCERTGNGLYTPGVTGVGHTRWATHGAPTDTNAHPHVSRDGHFAVVHNGIIENHRALRQELTEAGYSFESETDTEVVVHLLERYYDGDPVKAIRMTAARLEGSYALGILCTDHPDALFALREASPLILGVGAGENYFASDVTALVPYTRSVLYLEDGELARLTPDGVTVLDCAGAPVSRPVTRITWSVEAAEKGGAEHFMLKEILEQPAAVQAALSPRIKEGRVCLEGLSLTPDDLRGLNKIVLTACGSAYYAACAGRFALESLCRIPVEAELASELRYAGRPMDEKTLLIVLSQSGETADTIGALKEAGRMGARTLAVVNVVGSTIARLADDTLYTHAGPEIAVATTKGYTTQLAVLFLFALYAAEQRGTVDGEELSRLLARLAALPRCIQQTLDLCADLPRLAAKYDTRPSVFYLGRGIDLAAAQEGALKMKEISYRHAEAYAAGELKHGTIALMDEGQPVVALCCSAQLAEKTLNNVVEVKARGAKVLAIARQGDRAALAHADDVIFIPDAGELFQPAVEVIPLQLLAYHTAKGRGCDVDKPKNLAKSVTVE